MRAFPLLVAVGATLGFVTSSNAEANCKQEVLDFYRLVGPDIERAGYIADFSAAIDDVEVSDAFFFAHPYYVGYVEAFDAGQEVEPPKFLATDAVLECLTAHPQLSVAPEEIIGWAADLEKEVTKARRAELRLMMQSQ